MGVNVTRFRAQCATCMRVNEDPLALACPACGSRRLVALAGQRPAKPPSPPPPAPVRPPQIRKGSVVTLDSAHGPIERKVIKIDGDVLVIARQEELRAAKKEGRKPLSVGFKRKSVLSVKRSSRPVASAPPLTARCCHGRTSRGKPCRAPALLGRDFCGDHEPAKPAALPQVDPAKPPLEVRILPAGAEYDEPLAAIIYRALRRAEQSYPEAVRRDGEFLSAPLPVALAGLLAEVRDGG